MIVIVRLTNENKKLSLLLQNLITQENSDSEKEPEFTPVLIVHNNKATGSPLHSGG